MLCCLSLRVREPIVVELYNYIDMATFEDHYDNDQQIQRDHQLHEFPVQETDQESLEDKRQNNILKTQFNAVCKGDIKCF